MFQVVRSAVLAALVVGCGPGSGPTDPPNVSVASRGLFTPGCIDPTASPFNADGHDLVDDRVAMQAAIDHACTLAEGDRKVCFPAGEYLATRNPKLGATNLGSLQLRCTHLEITGEGPYATTIGMLGSGVSTTDPRGPGNWWLIDPQYAHHVVFKNIGFSGKRRIDTGEQTHLLMLKGPLDYPVIEDVVTELPSFSAPPGSVSCTTAPAGAICEMPNHGGGSMPCHAFIDPVTHLPRTGLILGTCAVSPGIDGVDRWTLLGWFGGGDCIRLLGEWPDEAAGIPNMLIRGAWISDWTAPDCDRSAFSLQRGNEGTVLQNSSLHTRFDQVLDSEPTGGKGYAGLIVRGVHFSRGGDEGGLTVSIGGSNSGTSSVEDFDCRGGSIPHGGTRFFDTGEATFRNCNFDSGLISSEPVVGILKRADRIRFIGGSMRKPLGSPPSFVVDIEHMSGAHATSVSLEGVTLIQGTPRGFIKATSLKSLTLRDVKMVYEAPTPWAGAAIMTEAIIAPVDAVSIAGLNVQAPAGSFTMLVSQGVRNGNKPGGISMIDVVYSPGSMRNGVVGWYDGRGASLAAVNVKTGPSLMGIVPLPGQTLPVCVSGCPLQ